MEFIWTKCGVEKNDWNKLRDAIWKRIFTSTDVLQG